MEYSANPEVVLTILQARAKEEPYLREVIRGAILEAVLLQNQTPETDGEEDDAE